MVKATSNDKPEPVQFLVTLQPVNDFVTLDNLPSKFRILCGAVGVKVLELKRVDDQDEEPAWGITVL